MIKKYLKFKYFFSIYMIYWNFFSIIKNYYFKSLAFYDTGMLNYHQVTNSNVTT